LGKKEERKKKSHGGGENFCKGGAKSQKEKSNKNGAWRRAVDSWKLSSIGGLPIESEGHISMATQGKMARGWAYFAELGHGGGGKKAILDNHSSP